LRFGGCFVYISVDAVMAAIGSAFTAGHFWKRARNAGPAKSNQKGSCPTTRCLAVARHARTQALLRGPAAIGHPWPCAATPASMPGCPLRNTCERPAWFNGAPRSKSRAEQNRSKAEQQPSCFFCFSVGAFDFAVASHHSSRPVGRCVLDLLLTLILGAPLNHAG